MLKKNRLAIEISKEAGVTLLEIHQVRAGRVAGTVVAPDGRSHIFTFPCSIHDWRGRKNKVAEIRRFVRGNP